MSAGDLNWVDRIVATLSPAKGLRRLGERRALAYLRGYEASEETRKRRFHRNTMSGETLARLSAMPLRNQARHLERNHDIARGILDKLVDFTVGPNGITVEPQPRTVDGEIHEEIAEELERDFAQWSEWPEVTWCHSRGSMERLAARTAYRDGEVLGQLVAGNRSDLRYSTQVPFAIQFMEADHLPLDLENRATNLRQGIERDQWGRPVRYHLLREHPGDDYAVAGYQDTVPVDAERILHPRHIDRIGQLRGITVLASIITRLQDLWEYEDSERIAAKMAASLVLKLTHGAPDVWDPKTSNYDPAKPPIFQMDGGMTYVSAAPGEDAEFFDTKRPYSGVEPFVNSQLRRISGGVGLTYSAVARDYNGTYSAQRQELVENWPHYHALTGQWVGEWSRPAYQGWVRWWALSRKRPLPANLDLGSLADALYLGPPMPWIDPEREVNAQIMQVQAAFKSSAAVVRERGGSLRDTYRQIRTEIGMRREDGITSTVDVPAVNNTPARPTAPESTPAPADDGGRAGAQLRVVK